MLREHNTTRGTATFLHTVSCVLFLTARVSTEHRAENVRVEFIKIFCSEAVFFFV